MKTTERLIIVLGLMVVVGTTFARGQNKPQLPDNCESIHSKLDAIGDKFPKLSERGSSLIIIGGSSLPTANKFDRIRLDTSRKYLVKYFPIAAETIVTAFGKPTQRLAYLRFYVNGSLAVEIITSNKSELCTGMGEALPL